MSGHPFMAKMSQTHMMPHQMITPPSSPQLVDLLLPQQAMDAGNIQPKKRGRRQRLVLVMMVATGCLES
jgi:hypothetical protein